MSRVTFTDAELHAIDAALSIAASVYDTDSATLLNSNQPRLARQFREQAQQAREIANRIAQS